MNLWLYSDLEFDYRIWLDELFMQKDIQQLALDKSRIIFLNEIESLIESAGFCINSFENSSVSNGIITILKACKYHRMSLTATQVLMSNISSIIIDHFSDEIKEALI